MAHRAPSSSSITYKWTYDVFLSFHGEDTRLGFTSYLYESLHKSGIHAFLDDKFIGTGENITPALFRAIQESRMAIIVFSEKYASSTFCLEELVKILECFKEESRLIYPVFYYVDPSELRRPRGIYAEALAQLEERFEDNRQKVEKWRQALSQAADLKGCHLKPKIAKEQECITKITKEVATRINRMPLHVTNYQVGLVSRVKEVISCLDLWSIKEIKMMGIWGAGGISKSTIARAVYNSIADNFEGSCFLSNVRKQSEMPNGLSHLQETLLCKLVMEKDLKLGDYHEGIPIIEHRLSQKKILLILDDVDKSDQLEALAGSCNWFGCGSRIIITTRNKQLLKSHDVKSIYDVNGLNGEESLKLLSWHAFKKESVDSNYMEVCHRAIDYLCGFPLALEVIGSNLGGKEANLWSSALDLFKSTPHEFERVFNALKLSYDTLGDVQKKVFLDLACFFNGEKLSYVFHILQCVRAIEPKYVIDMLVDKSLIRIEQGHVIMHDLIENMGKYIVQQESSNEPGKRSRLWFYQNILDVLQLNTGTEKVEAIILDLPESIEVQWSGKAFNKMTNLKMLVIRKACFSKCPKHLPYSLKWLEWKEYPFKFLPYQKFHYLSHLNLSNCKFLQQIPDLSGASDLRELLIDGCTNLIEIHDSVGNLNKLIEMSAMRCKNLKILPSCLRLPSLKHLNLFGCSSLQSFPEISVRMEEMKTLDLDMTAVTELPSSICNLIGLEILNVEECPNLKQLPASICSLPNLWKLTANLCEGLSHFKKGKSGDEESLNCSAMALKMEQLCFSNCNLSDDSLTFSFFQHFTNMMHLDLSFNNFTFLPECIKEYHNLKYLVLDHCNKLKHIGGMPPNLEKFSAICCTSLTELSKSKVLNQALFNFQVGKRNFILPGNKFPDRLHYYSQGSSMSFWVRNALPTMSLWILVKDEQDFVYNCKFSVHINDTKLDISSEWLLLSTIKIDHIYICDMHSIIRTELPLRAKWNEVKVSIESKTQEIRGEKEICFGVHVHNLQSNSENIRFTDPRRYITDYITDHIFQQKKQEQDVTFDSNSTKSAVSIDNPWHYQENNKLQPFWDLEILKVGGYRGTTFPIWSGGRTYDNLIKLRLTDCSNCWRIPALGQLPALKSLTIERLYRVVGVGSEFFKADYCASLIPFPSLEHLHFEDMISWEKWHSIDMKAFPKLRTFCFHHCPKLIGNLPLQLVSLECLEIIACPLLSSSIPKCPKIQALTIIESQNVVLQEQDLPPSLYHLEVSGARMLELLSHQKLHIEDLIVRNCSDEVPSPVIHMPPSVKEMHITDCENLEFVLASEAPLVHLRRISIHDCKFLRSLFDDMDRLLPNLGELSIVGCPEMEPFSAWLLPKSLKRLVIKDSDKLLSRHTEWRHLPTITELLISTPSQTWHCNGLQHLTSLQQLEIWDSPNLEKIEGGMMPPSLQRLLIRGCWILEERCHNKDGEIWPKITRVPYIILNGRRLRNVASTNIVGKRMRSLIDCIDEDEEDDIGCLWIS